MRKSIHRHHAHDHRCRRQARRHILGKNPNKKFNLVDMTVDLPQAVDNALVAADLLEAGYARI
jgi:hypothetical protein